MSCLMGLRNSSFEICNLVSTCTQRGACSLTYLQLGIGPSGYLDDHVQDCLLLIGIERNIVEGGEWSPVLFDIATVV